MNDEIMIICPNCSSIIDERDHQILCSNCGKIGDFTNNIPNFSKHKFYWNRIPKERLDQLNVYARKNGWKNALHDLLSPDEAYLLNYSMDESRADFLKIIPSSFQNGRILDLGCHMGNLSFLLAKSCKGLVAADSTFENLEFLQIRKIQEGVNNIYPVCIEPLDFGTLPFPDSYFDLVVLNGVLEWVGAVRTDLNPRDVQINALKEIKRVMKPDGYLYIGIENRFSYSYFFGSHDHSGVRFTSIMPKFLANMYTKLIRNSEYRTYIYSYWGYKLLLKESGFSEYNFFLSIPSYRYPRGILDVKERATLKKFIKKNFKDRPTFQILWAVLIVLHLEKVFSNSFSIVAQVKNKK